MAAGRFAGILGALEAALVVAIEAAVVIDIIMMIRCTIDYYRQYQNQVFANWYPQNDKLRHCVVACESARECGWYGSALLATGKEIKDFFVGKASLGDMFANIVGWTCAGAILPAIPLVRHLSRILPWSCEDCCKLIYCETSRGSEFIEFGWQDVANWFRSWF